MVSAERGGLEYGSRMEPTVAYPAQPHLNVQAKYHMKRKFAVDTDKIWLSLNNGILIADLVCHKA